MINPKISNSVPKVRDYKRIKALVDDYYKSPNQIDSGDSPLFDKTGEAFKEPTLAGEVQQHRVNDRPKTRSSIIFQKMGESSEPEYDKESVERLRRVQKAKALGEGISALFGAASLARDHDVPDRTDITTPFVMNRLNDLEGNYLNDIRRYRDDEMKRKYYNQGLENRELEMEYNASKQAERQAAGDEAASKRQKEAHDQEMLKIEKMKDSDLQKEIIKYGVGSVDDLARVKSEERVLNNAKKRAEINNLNKTEKGLSDEDQQVLSFLQNKIKSLRQKLSDPESDIIDPTPIQEEIARYESIIDSAKPTSLYVYRNEAQNWHDDQLATSALDRIADQVRSSGLTEDLVKNAAYAYMMRGVPSRDAERMAREELSKLVTNYKGGGGGF